MSLGPGGFVILFLSTLLPFSGTFNLSVNQGLYTTLGMVSQIAYRWLVFSHKPHTIYPLNLNEFLMSLHIILPLHSIGHPPHSSIAASTRSINVIVSASAATTL